jgi:phosphate-selective porin OprO/OprP
MRSKLLTIAFIFTIFSTAISQETNSPGVFGKGIFNLMGQDSTWSMKIAARMQLLGTVAWEKEPGGGFQ